MAIETLVQLYPVSERLLCLLQIAAQKLAVGFFHFNGFDPQLMNNPISIVPEKVRGSVRESIGGLHGPVEEQQRAQ